MFRPFLLFAFSCALAVVPLGSLCRGAERPSAPRLLPEKTLGYVRIENVMEMRESVGNSGVGRMMQDENLKPLVGDMYLIGEQLFQEASQFLGVSLDQLLSIPQGEVAFAVVPIVTEDPKEEDGPKDNSPDAIRARIEARRNRSPVGVVGLIDTAENAGYMRSIVQNVEKQATQGGVKRTVKTVSGTDVVSYSRTSGNGPQFSIAERNGVFVIGVGPNLVDDVLRRWDGDSKDSSLAQNTDFGNVMSHCVGAEDTRPQVTFYADPYHLVEMLVKANGGAAGLVWPILENLQIDKIKGIGGSSFAGDTDDFESIMHIHVLLESPRDGLFAVVRPGEGTTTPENWVPADVVSYTTLRWDLLKTYEGIGRIVGRFQSADAMERFVEQPFKQRTEIDLRADVLEELTGRVGIIRWNEPPMRLNSGTQIWALETKDIAKAEETMEKLASAFNNALKKDSYAGTTIYIGGGPQRGNFPENLRRPEPAVAIIGNYIVGSDSRKAIEHLIQTQNGVGAKLVDSPDYSLIAGEISGKLDAEKPFLFGYLRSEEVFRQIYDLAKDPKNREFMKSAAETNPQVGLLLSTLEKHDLPAFSAFSKYFAPSGSFAYDDPTGLHYAIFTLRPIE
jgi:hypothetical protein